MRFALLVVSFALLATPASAESPPQRDGGWSAETGDEPRRVRRARREGARMLEQALADRAVPERDARSGAAVGSADAQAKCAAAVQKRIAQGRTDAARRKLESCRRRHGGEPQALAR